MKKIKNLAILAVLAIAVAASAKIEATPIVVNPVIPPGADCGYWTFYMAGGVIPTFVWVSVPCQVHE